MVNLQTSFIPRQLQPLQIISANKALITLTTLRRVVILFDSPQCEQMFYDNFTCFEHVALNSLQPVFLNIYTPSKYCAIFFAFTKPLAVLTLYVL